MKRTLARSRAMSFALTIGITAAAVCTPRQASAVDTQIEIGATIDFGDVTVGSTKAIPVDLTNGGTDSFGPINIFGGAPPSPEFNASQNCQGNTLAAGASCQVTYSFQPGAPGTFNDESNFTVSETPSQSDGEDFSVSLTGRGVVTTTSTTLPCDANDCDDDACTVGDVCVAGICSAGSVLTAGRLSGLVLEATGIAIAACGVDRRTSVKKVVKPLIRAAALLAQAAVVATATEVGKKLAQARSAIDRVSQNLENESAGLNRGCAEKLGAALAIARTGSPCLP